MKQRRLPLLLLLAAGALLVAACGDGGAGGEVTTSGAGSGMTPVATAVPSPVRIASRGVPFVMVVDDLVGLASEATAVRFVEVVEDSRCPEDETCVWEGAVAVAIGWETTDNAGTVVLRGISFPEGPYFGDAPTAMLPGGATIELLGLDGLDGVASVTVVWDEATT